MGADKPEWGLPEAAGQMSTAALYGATSAYAQIGWWYECMSETREVMARDVRQKCTDKSLSYNNENNHKRMDVCDGAVEYCT